jgi:ABC-type hemin transport system substrate-binding protein
LEPEPRRILALVPSLTRCLFDLGVGERVVGRTDYCVEPADRMAALPPVGGPRSVSVERVLTMEPDLVLADAEENEREQVEELQRQGLRVYVTLPRSLRHVADFLHDLATLTRRPEAADWADELLWMRSSPPRPDVPVACLVWRAPFLAAGSDTLPAAILAAAGGRNVIPTIHGRRYPEVTLADLNRAQPRVILLPDEPYRFTSGDAVEIEAAVAGAVALRIPGEWVAWYGSRMGGAIRDLAERLDPHRPSLPPKG